MRQMLIAGTKLFNSGEYWEAHEAWELPWNAAKANGNLLEANYIQGLILLAAAIHKRRHYQSPRGGLLNLEKALKRLGNLPVGYSLQDGFDVQELQLKVRAALDDESIFPQLPIQ